MHVFTMLRTSAAQFQEPKVVLLVVIIITSYRLYLAKRVNQIYAFSITDAQAKTQLPPKPESPGRI